MEIYKNVKNRYIWNRDISFFDNISSGPTYLIIFLMLLFFFNLGKRDFWAPGEPRYAQVSQEMWETKDFVLPHLNNEKYPDKPPVLFWLINIFSIPFGKITEFSARLPSAFAGIGCAILTFYLVKQIFSNLAIPDFHPHRIGFLSALILSTSIEYTVASRRVSFDVLLTFFITLSLFCFYTGYIRKERKKRYFLLSYLFMSIATITKGPVGFVIPILIISVFICVTKFRNRQSVISNHISTSRIQESQIQALQMQELRIQDMHIGWGAIILFSIPLLWVAGIYFQGGWEHTKEVVFMQNLGRTVNSWSHKRPFYYFFVNFPLHFFPWSIFIPSVLIYFLKSFNKNPYKLVSSYGMENNNHTIQNSRTPQSALRNSQSVLLFPCIWFIVVFVFFSFMSGKRSTYVLPLYPAASLFVALFLNAFFSSPQGTAFKRLGFLPLQFAYIVLIIIGLGISIWIYYYHNVNFISTLPVTVIFICGQVISFRYLLQSNPFKSLISSFIVLLITVILGTQLIIPVFNVRKSAKPFCEKANQIIGPSGKLASFNYFRSVYLFYTGRRHIEVIKDVERLNEYLKAHEQVFLLLREKSFKELKKRTDSTLYMLTRNSIGHRTILLASNRPNIEKVEWDVNGNDVMKK